MSDLMKHHLFCYSSRLSALLLVVRFFVRSLFRLPRLFLGGINIMIDGFLQCVSAALSELCSSTLSGSSCFRISPPSLISIYLFNLKQTKLFAFINH